MKRIILAICILLIGVGVLGYPTLSNYLAEKNGSYALDTYEKEVKKQNQAQLLAEWRKAKAFNENLAGNPVHDPFVEGSGYAIQGNYFNVLNVNNTMGRLEIPKIKVELPIYHGTEAETLKRGIGHLEGSSLPTGGKSTHSVLTGHTGLSGAKMLTDLTELGKGDLFYLTILDKTFAYRVDKIQVVEPEQVDALKLIKGEDHCTLLTCTPYGVNSHRLLVRGVRTKYVPEEKAKIKSVENTEVNRKVMIAAIVTAGVMLLLIGIRLYLIYKENKKAENLGEK
ncbi:class C sortase [Enterococcus florum]|uniref:Class C sortase n=1 Tax=Enterococcus florum TaxID=2480627 RepID=A0A4P5PD45_9ENTE|nr:class C sortase [Enterococcus florum]GCF95826.1 class C sortase [Enterococcus florum]